MRSENNWLFGRVAVIAATTSLIWSIPEERSNLDWAAAVLLGAVIAVALYIWLRTTRNRDGIEWSGAYAVQTPFLPMSKYPLRYWVVASYALMVGGSVSVVRDLLRHSGRSGVPGTFAFLGLYIALAVGLSTRRTSSEV